MSIKDDKITENIIKIDYDHWTWYFKIPKQTIKILGKYLFFSTDKKELINIAINELKNNNFPVAKINTDDTKKGDEYVLCLYYYDDSRKKELYERYKSNDKVKYRYWKSDETTLKGKYSDEFLNNLTPEEKEEWTRQKI